MTYNILLIVIMVVALLLILIVLVQNPKGGGLSSSLGGGSTNAIGGVQSTNEFLDKATWTLAISLLVLILVSTMVIPRDKDGVSELKETIENRNTAPVNNQPADIENLINNTKPAAPTK